MTARREVAGLLAALAIALPAPAAAECRLALILALDVSGSIDDREYRLQLDGLASALTRPRVARAFLALPDAPVLVSAFEWSGRFHQRELQPWTLVTGPDALAGIASRLRAASRVRAPHATGLGAALEHAASRFTTAPLKCWRQTLDVSGDGKNNDWPSPRDVYSRGGLAKATVNALVIGQDARRGDDLRRTDIPELMAYFGAEIIRGPNAFIEVAIGYEDYEEAMARKLQRELEGLTIGSTGNPAGGDGFVIGLSRQ